MFLYNSYIVRVSTYELVYSWMHPAGGNGFDGGDGLQAAGGAKAVPYHGLHRKREVIPKPRFHPAGKCIDHQSADDLAN